MRLKLSLAVAATLGAAGTAVVLSMPSANAIVCPPGTVSRPVYVAGRPVASVCLPGNQCDPRPCDPTAAPARD